MERLYFPSFQWYRVHIWTTEDCLELEVFRTLPVFRLKSPCLWLRQANLGHVTITLRMSSPNRPCARLPDRQVHATPSFGENVNKAMPLLASTDIWCYDVVHVGLKAHVTLVTVCFCFLFLIDTTNKLLNVTMIG